MKKLFTFLLLFLSSCAHLSEPRNDVSVTLYGAEWCPACKNLEPSVKSIVASRGATLKEVDIDKEKPQEGEITWIPAIAVYRNDKLYYFGPLKDEDWLQHLLWPITRY